MSDGERPQPGGARTGDRYVYDPATQPDLFESILSRRIVAFIIDAVIIVVLMIPAVLVVAIVGLITFGLGWFLFGPLFAIVALGYIGFTLGGAASATIGMRMAGLELRTWSGAPMFPLLAVMHALIFWISIGVLTPFVLLVGFFTYRKQLLHDLLIGVVMVNAPALRKQEP